MALLLGVMHRCNAHILIAIIIKIAIMTAIIKTF